jgi:hypothetical protein
MLYSDACIHGGSKVLVIICHTSFAHRTERVSYFTTSIEGPSVKIRTSLVLIRRSTHGLERDQIFRSVISEQSLNVLSMRNGRVDETSPPNDIQG